MRLEHVRKVLEHWYQRQEDLGPESAFRFSAFIGAKRKLRIALYPTQSSDEEFVTRRQQIKKGKK